MCFEGSLNGHAYREWSPAQGPGARRHSTTLRLAQRSPASWSTVRLRTGTVRSLCRTDRRQGSAVLRYASLRRYCQSGNHHARRAPARWAKQKGLSAQEAENTLHPVQQAWIEEQTPQCGFCQNGMMIKATELLESNPNPTIVQIKQAFTTSGLSPNLCRCGTYVAIIEAVQHAATIMAKGR